MTNWAIPLLADTSPCLRFLVLRELMGRADDDPEVIELEGLRATDPLVVARGRRRSRTAPGTAPMDAR